MFELSADAIAAGKARLKALEGAFIPVQLGAERARTLNIAAVTAFYDAVVDAVAKGEIKTVAGLNPAALLSSPKAFFDAPSKVAKDEVPDQPTVSSISTVALTNRVPTLRSWPVAEVFPGLVIMMGVTGSGKSVQLNDKLKPDVLIRWGEPYEMYDAQENAIHPSNADEVIAMALVFGALGLRVAIDSLRTLVFKLKGPASTGGIITTFYSLLTDLSNLFNQFDAAVVAIVNPMVQNDMVDFVYQQSIACTAGGILCADGAIEKSTYRKRTGRVFLGTDASQDSVVVSEYPMPKPINIGELDDPLPARIASFRGDRMEDDDRGAVRTANNFDL